MEKILLENYIGYKEAQNRSKEELKIVGPISILDFSTLAYIGNDKYFGKEAAVIYYLAEMINSKGENFLGILSVNYILSGDEDIAKLQKLPFFNPNKYFSDSFSTHMIVDKLPKYVCDNEFEIENINDPKTTISMEGFDISNMDSKSDIVRIEMSIDVFSTIKFIDEYIQEDVINNHDLLISLSSTTKESKLFVVDEIPWLLGLSRINRKSTSVAVAFRAHTSRNSLTTEYIDNSISILMPIDLKIKFRRRKFKDKLNTVLDKFLEDDDQYLNSFIFYARFKNIDKEYLCIKAFNKNEESKLILLDSAATKRLKKLIMDY